MNFNGKILWDRDKPDGTARKKLDNSYINNLNWKPKINLDEGIKNTIISYKKQLLK